MILLGRVSKKTEEVCKEFNLKHNLIDLEDFELRNAHKNKTQSISLAPFLKGTFLKWRVFFFCHFLMQQKKHDFDRSLGISKDCWHVLLRDAAWHGNVPIEGMACHSCPLKFGCQFFGILTGMGWPSFGFWNSNGMFRKSQRIIFFPCPYHWQMGSDTWLKN